MLSKCLDLLLDCLHKHISSRLQERFPCRHAPLHATCLLISPLCDESLLSRDGHIADCTVRHPVVERLFSSLSVEAVEYQPYCIATTIAPCISIGDKSNLSSLESYFFLLIAIQVGLHKLLLATLVIFLICLFLFIVSCSQSIAWR